VPNIASGSTMADRGIRVAPANSIVSGPFFQKSCSLPMEPAEPVDRTREELEGGFDGE
jgi:hypothetical protein